MEELAAPAPWNLTTMAAMRFTSDPLEPRLSEQLLCMMVITVAITLTRMAIPIFSVFMLLGISVPLVDMLRVIMVVEWMDF